MSSDDWWWLAAWRTRTGNTFSESSFLRLIDMVGSSSSSSLRVPMLSKQTSRGLLEWCATLLDRIVFSCLLGLIVTTSIPYGTAEPWWESIFESAVFVITAIWILKVLVQGKWEVRGLFILL